MPKVHSCLKQGGTFVFSVEHPIFTSRPEQEWILDDQGSPLYWPVDHYQDEGVRNTAFLTDHVIKYHRTLSTYINDLIRTGFAITAVREPLPDPKLMHHPGMKDETRRPMFLILSAEKNKTNKDRLPACPCWFDAGAHCKAPSVTLPPLEPTPPAPEAHESSADS